MNKNKKVFMWYKVKELWEIGLNKSQISRELGLDRGTVRKYLVMDELTFSQWIKNPRRLPKKLSAYYNYVKDILEITPYLSAAQVEDRLKENFNDLPKVSSKTVYNFVMGIRRRHAIHKYKKLRQYQKLPEVEYGSEGQVDFGEYNMQGANGSRRKVYFFTMVLSRSRYKFVYFQGLPFTAVTASYAHELAFSYFGGYPRRIIYDQDRVFVNDENLGDILLTEGFMQFSQQYSFEPVFCKKSDPESKGKIENVVRYVKYNFLKGRNFIDIGTLQKGCLSWLDRTANAKVHGTTGKVPKKEWEIEKRHLKSCSKQPEKPISQLPEYKVRKDNTIAYRGNFYSLPIGTYQGTNSAVQLEDKNGMLTISTRGSEFVASHKIPAGRGNYVRNSDHGRKKSKTIKKMHDTLLFELGGTQKALDYLTALEEDKPRYYHDNMRAMLEPVKESGQKAISRVLDFCLENNVFNGYRFVEVLAFYNKEESSYANNTKINIPELDTNIDYKSIQVETSNINFYENII